MSPLRIWAVALRHLTELRHTPARANDILIWPFIDTLLFGSIAAFLAARSPGDVSAAYVLSGLFLFHVVFQSTVSLSLAFISETGDRNLLNLAATPLRTVEYFFGLVVFGLIKMIAGLSFIALLALTLFDYNVLNGGIGLIPVMAALILVGIGLSLVVISLQVRFGRSAETVTFAIAAFIPTLSGAFVPIDALPSFLQPVARIFPTSHAFDAVREMIGGAPLPLDALAITTLGGAATLVVGMLALTASIRSFRSRGLVSRYS